MWIALTHFNCFFFFVLNPFFSHWLLHKPVHALNFSSVSSGLYYTNLRDTCQHLLGSHCESVPGVTLCECWRGDSCRAKGALVSQAGTVPADNWIEGARRSLIIPTSLFFPLPHLLPVLQPRHRKWGLCERRAALIFMYTFFFPPFFSQHIMTPDYVTTGFVSDCSETRRN